MLKLSEAEKITVYNLVKQKVHYFHHLASFCDKDDATQDIYLFLIPYLERNYEKARSNFNTFVEFKTKKLLLDMSDKHYYGTTYNRRKLTKVEKAKELLRDQKKEVTWTRLRELTGLSQKQMNSIFSLKIRVECVESDISSYNRYEDSSPEEMEQEESLKSLMDSLLSPKQKTALVKKYVDKKTMKAISEDMSMELKEVKRLLHSGLSTIKEHKKVLGQAQP